MQLTCRLWRSFLTLSSLFFTTFELSSNFIFGVGSAFLNLFIIILLLIMVMTISLSAGTPGWISPLSISWVRLPWPQPTQAVTQNPWPVPRRDARVLPIGLKRGHHFPELLSHSIELSWVEKLSSVVPGSPTLVDRLSLGYYESKALLPSHANRTTSEPGSRILH